MLLVGAVTLIFAWVLWPFSSAILWNTVLAVLFAPLHRRVLRSFGLSRYWASPTNSASRVCQAKAAEFFTWTVQAPP